MGFLDKIIGKKAADSAGGGTPKQLTKAAQAAEDKGDLAGAIALYEQVLPQLADNDEERWWYEANIADMAGEMGDYDKSGRMAQASLNHGAIMNPMPWFRLGQALFETGKLDGAADTFMRAYMLEPAVFEDLAPDKPQYLEFLGTRAKLNGEN